MENHIRTIKTAYIVHDDGKPFGEPPTLKSNLEFAGALLALPLVGICYGALAVLIIRFITGALTQ